MRQIGGVVGVLWFPPPIKTDCHDITDILLKVALKKRKRKKIACMSPPSPTF
jgi:hypothetical protein